MEKLEQYKIHLGAIKGYMTDNDATEGIVSLDEKTISELDKVVLDLSTYLESAEKFGFKFHDVMNCRNAVKSIARHEKVGGAYLTDLIRAIGVYQQMKREFPFKFDLKQGPEEGLY